MKTLNIFQLMLVLSFFSFIGYASEVCSKTVYYYNGNYRICKDLDGWLVTKPDGSKDAWGNGYSLSEVASGYGLKKYKSKKENTSNCECN